MELDQTPIAHHGPEGAGGIETFSKAEEPVQWMLEDPVVRVRDGEMQMLSSQTQKLNRKDPRRTSDTGNRTT